jgi:hypothetical protein
VWEPSFWGRSWLGEHHWSIVLGSGGATVSTSAGSEEYDLEMLRTVTVHPGWAWAKVTAAAGLLSQRPLRAISNGSAATLQAAVTELVSRHDGLEHLRNQLVTTAPHVLLWWDRVSSEWMGLDDRWIPSDTVSSWISSRPHLDRTLLDALYDFQLVEAMEGQPAALRTAVEGCRA